MNVCSHPTESIIPSPGLIAVMNSAYCTAVWSADGNLRCIC